MFRVARSSRCKSSAAVERPHAVFCSRLISDDAKQEIIQRLLSSQTVTNYDVLTRTKRTQLAATLNDFLPQTSRFLRQGGTKRRFLADRLARGQHLIYFPTKVATSDLLPDGTVTDHSPGDPWSHRLWAGGRIQFPQRTGPDLKEPYHMLAEYVRDVRITGPESQEKIFVKIERRMAKTHITMTSQALVRAEKLKERSEDTIGEALIVETRDLCFLREQSSPATFKRRHITPPTDPEHSHTLVPTPALLFRYSALTFNAHAIHIDPEYTRNVYGLPNLLVHGPLALTMMLEYMRRILFTTPGRSHEWVPVITEINYRNLAPLFANEEMTICVKKKRGVVSSDNAPLPPAPDTASGVDIGAGFQSPPSGEDDSIVITLNESSESKVGSPKVADKRSKSTSDTEELAQEWEVWIQTGKGDAASLAVRGTIRTEPFDKAKQLPDEEDSEGASKKQSKAKPGIASQKNGTASPSRLTAEELEILAKARDLLHLQQGRYNPVTDFAPLVRGQTPQVNTRKQKLSNPTKEA